MKLALEKSRSNFEKSFYKSGQLSEKHKKHIPGGFSRRSLAFGPHPVYVDHGSGQFIYTVDGHKLLDLHNNFTCNVLGHNHPEVVNAIQEVLSKGFSFGNPMAYEHRLAQILCDRIESLDRVVFCCSASEACISAVRYARCYTGKEKIAKFEGGYQGLGEEFMVSMHPSPEMFPGAAAYPRAVPNTGGIAQHTLENVVVLPQNDLVSCKRILTQNAYSIACVIMELQTGAGGLIVLDQEFVKGIRKITEELGILLVVDETVTLRLAFHGLQGDYGIKPDLTVMGKMIGGGLPLGAVGGREELLQLNEEGVVYHSGTHHGHPLATAAGIATLETMDEETYNQLNIRSEKLKKDLNDWAAKRNYPFFVNGIGSHLEIDFTDQPGRRYRSCRDAATYSNEELIHTFVFELLNRGIFPMYRGQISLSVPMTDKDVEMIVETSKHIVEEILE